MKIYFIFDQTKLFRVPFQIEHCHPCMEGHEKFSRFLGGGFSFISIFLGQQYNFICLSTPFYAHIPYEINKAIVYLK